MLKTLWTGHDAGIANTSPRKPRCGWARAAELSNTWLPWATPADSIAERDAGIVPPLTAMATKLHSPPRPMSHAPGSPRFM